MTGRTEAQAASRRTKGKKSRTASDYWEQGNIFHEDKNWAGAIVMYGKAYSMDPKPRYLWSLARDEHRANMWDRAEKHYRAFIALKEVPPELRDTMASLRAKAAQYLVEVSKAKAAGDEAATTHPGLDPGLISQADADSGGKTAGWVLLGGGVALVAGGVGATVAASAATDDMQKYSAPPTQALVDPYQSKYGDAQDTRSTALTASYVLYGLGAAGAVTGLVMVLTGGSSEGDTADGDTADGNTPEGNTASRLGLASLRPVFLPSGGGVAATLSF